MPYDAQDSLMIPTDVSETILIDCDGVLLNWSKGFRDAMQRDHSITMRSEWPSVYNIGQWLPDEHADRALELIQRFNGDPDCFGYLEPMPGAVDFVEHAASLGRDLKIVTACAHEGAQARIDNISRVFGADRFSEVIFVDLMASKEEVLSAYDRSIWIDDRPKHVHEGIAAGHFGVLCGASHNQLERQEENNRHLPYIVSLEDLIGRIPGPAPAAPGAL